MRSPALRAAGEIAASRLESIKRWRPDMTPSQKLIDAAAKEVFDMDCAKSKIAPWLQWSEATEAERNDYRARVTVPVTVALRAAADIAKHRSRKECCEPATEEGTSLSKCCGNFILMPLSADEIAISISSLIPQETQNGK